MKTLLILMVALVVLVGFYYFWLADRMQESDMAEENGASLQGTVTVPSQPQKYFPPGTVMEDGTI